MRTATKNNNYSADLENYKYKIKRYPIV
jgi:hypothetical protein